MRDEAKRFHVISSEMAGMNMTVAIATEAKSIYERIAELICRPGESRKAMDNKVSRALGGYPLWRTRACRLGEAGCSSAAAILDLQTRYRAFLDREATRAAQAHAIEQAKQSVAERDYVRVARADYQDLTRRIAALEAALRVRS